MSQEEVKQIEKVEGLPKKRLIIEFDGKRWGIIHTDFNVLELKEIARELLEILSGKVGVG